MIKYPYSDFHEMNLDWVLEKVKELGTKVDDFESEVAEVKAIAEDVPKIKVKQNAMPTRVYFKSDDNNSIFIVIRASVSGGAAYIEVVTKWNNIEYNGYIVSQSGAAIVTADTDNHQWYSNMTANQYCILIPLVGDVDFID